MNGPEEQLNLVRQLCPEAQLVDEGGGKTAFLPAFEFPHMGVERRMDLLLIPFPHSGYENRLFFAERLPPGQNPRQPQWTTQMAIGRNWAAPSVRGIGNDRPWPEMIAAFLRVVG